jgi:hypothetical protein
MRGETTVATTKQKQAVRGSFAKRDQAGKRLLRAADKFDVEVGGSDWRQLGYAREVDRGIAAA